MASFKEKSFEQDADKKAVSIDITKIVKYSCVSSVLIVFIIFASSLIKELMRE